MTEYQHAALLQALAEQTRLLERLVNLLEQWDKSGMPPSNSNEYTPPPSLKVGDVIKVIDDKASAGARFFRVGDHATVVSINSGDIDADFNMACNSRVAGNGRWYLHVSECVRVV